METVITALDEGTNALLESPTGTGKTLCLLCACLSWRRAQLIKQQTQLHTWSSERGPQVVNHGMHRIPSVSGSLGRGASSPSERQGSVPQIIYTTRTHSQLAQVVKELKNTLYGPSVRVLGSRQQLCVNKRVRALDPSAQSYACRRLTQTRGCVFRRGLDAYLSRGAGIHTQVQDIEDLVAYGESERFCPYFYSRERIGEADILVMPYNYLFDRQARSQLKLTELLQNAVVIFDEAHNIEAFSTSSASFELPAVMLTTCINEVSQAIKALEERQKSMIQVPTFKNGSTVKVANLQVFSARLIALEDAISKLPTSRDGRLIKTKDTSQGNAGNGGNGGGGQDGEIRGDRVFSGDYIYNLFLQAGITPELAPVFPEMADIVTMLALEADEAKGADGLNAGKDINGTSGGGGDEGRSTPLGEFARLVDTIIVSGAGSPEHKAMLRRNYRLVISQPETQTQKGFSESSVSAGPTLSYCCFNPSMAMLELQSLGVRSFLLTSGTLSPMASMAQELGLSFPHQLENTHVIDPDQVFVGVVNKGPLGKTLNSSFANRNDLDRVNDLGSAIANFAKTISGGLLVFFPSYPAMTSALQEWTSSSSTGGSTSGQTGKYQSSQYRGEYGSTGRGGQQRRPGQRIGFQSADEQHEETYPEGSILNRIARCKRILVEPKAASQFPAIMALYRQYVETGQGAIFFGVCRGKASEGFDFSDAAARGVVLAGIPFPALLDAKVVLKQAYLDDIAKMKQNNANTTTSLSSAGDALVNATLTGAEWYILSGMRAVNQALGRVIRHRRDYGAVLLCDERFGEPRFASLLSKWLRHRLVTYSDFGPVTANLAKFFRMMRERFPEPISRPRGILAETELTLEKHGNRDDPSNRGRLGMSLGNALAHDKHMREHGKGLGLGLTPKVGVSEEVALIVEVPSDLSGNSSQQDLKPMESIKGEGTSSSQARSPANLASLLRRNVGAQKVQQVLDSSFSPNTTLGPAVLHGSEEHKGTDSIVTNIDVSTLTKREQLALEMYTLAKQAWDVDTFGEFKRLLVKLKQADVDRQRVIAKASTAGKNELFKADAVVNGVLADLADLLNGLPTNLPPSQVLNEESKSSRVNRVHFAHIILRVLPLEYTARLRQMLDDDLARVGGEVQSSSSPDEHQREEQVIMVPREATKRKCEELSPFVPSLSNTLQNAKPQIPLTAQEIGIQAKRILGKQYTGFVGIMKRIKEYTKESTYVSEDEAKAIIQDAINLFTPSSHAGANFALQLLPFISTAKGMRNAWETMARGLIENDTQARLQDDGQGPFSPARKRLKVDDEG